MFTYEFTLVNEDNCKKNVIISADNYFGAIKKIKNEYGIWSVYDYKIINSNY